VTPAEACAALALPDLLTEARRVADVNEQYSSHVVATVIRELAQRLDRRIVCPHCRGAFDLSLLERDRNADRREDQDEDESRPAADGDAENGERDQADDGAR
jgi:hypothetical protein